MNMTRDRVRSIVWTIVFAVSAALLLALTLRVNAVKAQVQLTERRIMALRQEKLSLETEFQTRANQQQLAAINAVEFGFKAPAVTQYVEGERQLAGLVARPIVPPTAPGATGPVLMAQAAAPAIPAAKPAPRAQLAGADTGGRSLPKVLGALASRPLTAGHGTRMLSEHNEVRVDKASIDKRAPSARPVLAAKSDAPAPVAGKRNAAKPAPDKPSAGKPSPGKPSADKPVRTARADPAPASRTRPAPAKADAKPRVSRGATIAVADKPAASRRLRETQE